MWGWIIAAIAAVLAGASSVQQSRAQRVQYKAQEQANEFNAALQRQRAAEVTVAYDQREEQQRRKNRIEAGKRAAAIGESGLGFGGSNADIDLQSAVFAELDALNIRYEGQLESRGLLAQSGVEDYYARSARMNAATIRSNTWLNAASSALGAGSSAYYGYTSRGRG